MPRAPARDKLIARLAKLATVSHVPEEEHEPIEGNFSYGDPAEDKRMEEHVRICQERTIWGWCCVKTTAEYGGFKGTTYLGCCCYESAEDFAEGDGDAQTFEACAALLDNIIGAKVNGLLAAEVLRKLGAR